MVEVLTDRHLSGRSSTADEVRQAAKRRIAALPKDIRDAARSKARKDRGVAVWDRGNGMAELSAARPSRRRRLQQPVTGL